MLKRVKSDNSLQPQQGSTASEEWQAVPSDRQSVANTSTAEAPSSAPKAPQENPRQDQSAADRERQAAELRARDAGAVSSGETASGQVVGRERNVDAGNVMGMPVNAAQWRSKGGFIGRPRARVSLL